MIGILLIAIGQFFSEIGTSIGKYEAEKKKESIYAVGFLHSIWAGFLMFMLVLWKGEFVFSMASLPTFTLRAILEIILIFVGTEAVIRADRSTFSFLHTFTIPLLLVADVLFGYEITVEQIMGISLIAFAILLLFMNHGLGRDGKILSIMTAVIAVGTIALYKYNITHFNSVEAEQSLMYVIILLSLLVTARIKTGENLFGYLKHKVFFFQSLASGAGSIFMSFAYLFAPASIIITSKRALEIFAAMIFGRTFFHEKHLAVKIIALILSVSGILLMIWG